jgi:hypothetical protein
VLWGAQDLEGARPTDQSYICCMTREVEQLLRELDGARKGALRKLDGLSEVDARRSTVDSGTNLAGLIQHLTFVGSRWFEHIVGGRSSHHGIRSMQVDPSVSLRELRAAYKASWAVSNEIIKGLGDGDAPLHLNGKKHGRVFPGGNAVNVAVAVARAGGSSGYIGVVGDDARGRWRSMESARPRGLSATYRATSGQVNQRASSSSSSSS